jgi:LysM repeat protein
MPAEMDEPLYVEGVQLKRQGRYPEALSAFLKVIDKRGARSAPESHVEAGVIFLNHSKDPIYACYHFRRYLELQPNSKQAELVRGMVNTAKREFARTLPGRPMDDQSVRMQTDEEISTLRRENAELRAEIATLRGGVAPLNRAPRMITVPDEALGSVPPPPVATVDEPTAAGMSPRSAPPAAVPPPATVPPPKAAVPSRPAARTHAVAAKDTLYGISVKYYGNGRQVEAIYQANRDVMKDRTDLRPGMVLKIPALEASSAPRK